MCIRNPRRRATDDQGRVIERRKTVRLSRSEFPGLKSVSLLAGPAVRLINLSGGGALLESSKGIQPGVSICIRLVGADDELLLRGRVLESRATSLRGSELIYQSRIAFDQECSLRSLKREEQPAIDEASLSPSIEEAAQAAEHFPGVLEEEADSTLTVTVPVPQSEGDLRRVFGL